MSKQEQSKNRQFFATEYFPTLRFFFSKKKYILYFCIPLTGIVCSSLGFCHAFQRSGAVLIAVAIYLAYYKQGFIARGEYFKDKYENTSDLSDPKVVKRDLLRSNKNITEEKAEKFAQLAVSSRRNYKLSADLAEKLGKEFYKAEAIMGISGTLIWAFGDFICWCKYPLNILCIFYR